MPPNVGRRRRTSVSLGRAALLVENLSVPFDRRVWQEATSLRRAGYDVSVICPRGQNQDVEAHVVIDGVSIHRYPLRAAGGGPTTYIGEYASAFRSTISILRRLQQRSPFDVVHACNPPDPLICTALPARRKGAALVFDHHDLVPELFLSRFGRAGLLHRATLVAERLAFRLADVVLSTNDSYREIAITRGRKRAEDVFVVRSAPDIERFQRVPADPTLRDSKAYLLAYLGVMGPQDGVDHALRALATLRTTRNDWRAIFIGGGDVLEEMRGLAAQLNLSDAVVFTGRIPDDDVIRILSSADVCLAPDPRNPLNDLSTMNKIVEYMSLSRPLVSYDLREARVSAGEAALYARADDVDDFARCIGTLLDSQELRDRMGAAGRRRVEDEISWARSEGALLAAYERARHLAHARAGR
jgi:glycosyltransferase involved in cell wall biosynthesis